MSVISGFLDGIRPIKRLSPSEWAEENRRLSSGSAEPGPWRNSRTPYLREIMDCFGPRSEVQEIIFMKGSQIGATEAGFNVLGFYIDMDPCNMLYVMPTESTAKRNSLMRFDPMVNATDSLKKKIPGARTRDSQNAILQKSFPGGTMIFCGANSAAPLRSIPARVVILDEVDAMPASVDDEGDPLSLAKARTRTFFNRKIAVISTPTTEGESLIEAEYNTTSKRRYFVPCPHCGVFQVLEWENMRWTPGRPHSARYICEGCDAEIEERHKPYLLGNGEWRDTAPENINPIRVGYHLSALYSPFGWYSWAEAVADFEDAEKKEDENKKKVFQNTVLGKSYKIPGEVPEWSELFERRENYLQNGIPSRIAVLTAGVDVQGDRLEVEIVGWCAGNESFSIDYRVLIGDTSNTSPGSVWDELAKIVTEVWSRDDRRQVGLAKMAVDSGYNTTAVYTFCRRFHPSQVIPIKGLDGLKIPVSTPTTVDVLAANGRKIGKLGLWSVGSSILKSELYGWLKLSIGENLVFPPGYCHFPVEYGEHYFRMLTAEKIEQSMVKGFTKYEWVKRYKRNEALDCRVYARAAAVVVGVDRWTPEIWQQAAGQYVQAQQATTPTPKGKRKSDFWR